MYRSIETDTWADPWFSELSAPGKLVFLYLVTNSHVDAAGCCELTLRVMAFETGLEEEQLAKIVPRLAPQIIWWPGLNIFWVRNFLRRQSANTNAVNFRKAAARSLHDRPSDVSAVVCEEYPELAMVADASQSVKQPHHASPMHADASPMHAVTVPVPVTAAGTETAKRQPTVAQSAQRSMFGALAESFGKPTPGPEHERYEAAARDLIKAGANPSEIPRLCEAWEWINPPPVRVNSLAGQLTLLRNAKPRPPPNGKNGHAAPVSMGPYVVPEAELTPRERAWRDATPTEKAQGEKAFIAAFVAREGDQL